jgi:hypothetical protein
MDAGLHLRPDGIVGLLPHPPGQRDRQIAPSATIQQLCEASGGTSIYCNNYQRPLPFSDRSLANFAPS